MKVILEGIGLGLTTDAKIKKRGGILKAVSATWDLRRLIEWQKAKGIITWKDAH